MIDIIIENIKDKLNNNFNEILRKILEKRNLTLDDLIKDFAFAQGISEESASKILNSKDIPAKKHTKVLLQLDSLVGIQTKDFLPTFSKFIIDYCKKNKIKRSELAEETQIPYNTLNYLEHGKVTPSAQNLMVLAEFFEVTVDFILNYDPNEDVVKVKGEKDKFKRIQELIMECDKEELKKIYGFLKSINLD